jgi:hypothetical protein
MSDSDRLDRLELAMVGLVWDHEVCLDRLTHEIDTRVDEVVGALRVASAAMRLDYGTVGP